MVSLSIPSQHAAVIQALPEPSLLITDDGIILAHNAPALRIVGQVEHTLINQSLSTIASDAPEKIERYLRGCAAGRQPIPGTLTLMDQESRPTVWRCEGAVVEPRTLDSPALVLLRLRPKESAVDKFVVLNRTIDDLNAEIRERRHAEARLRFLAEVSITLAASPEYEDLLSEFVQLLTTDLTDWATVFLVEADGTLTHAVTWHSNSAKQDLAQQMCKSLFENSMPTDLIRAVLGGQSLFYPRFREQNDLNQSLTSQTLTAIERVGPKSVVVVPLHARGRCLGILALAWSESERYYTETDLAFIEEVARRAAMVVENARLYQEARAAEAELRKFNYSLERLIDERTNELEHTNQELERSNHELDQFAYVASHDLKAPLRAIKHLADWIAEDSGDSIPQVALENLGRMHQRIARMERLLDDLLAYSRAGRQSHAPETINTVELVESIGDLVNGPDGYDIVVDQSLPVLRTERVPLETVFRNLIQNAIKHHHDPANGCVHITARTMPESVEFSVEDNGPGIAPQFHTRIFEIFQSLRPRDHIEGSGIGLAVVKKIVERRGGTITVESDAGSGAIFRFTWPLANSTAQ